MLQLLRYIKPYIWHVAALFLITLTGILLEMYLPTLMAGLVDIGIVNGDIGFIARTGGWMLACAVAAMGLTILGSFVASRISMGFGRDVRKRLFFHVQQFSQREFDKFGPASLITRTTNDVKQVQDVMIMMLRMMMRAPLMLVGGIIMAVMQDTRLSLILVAALPALSTLIFLISRKAIPLYGQLQEKTDRLNLLLRETLMGTRVVRAFNRTEYEKKRFNLANEDYRDTGIRVSRIMASMFPVITIVMNATSIAIVWFGAIRIDQGNLQVGSLIAFLQYAMMILFSLIMLSMAFVMIPRAQASAKRLNEVLLLETSIHDPETSRKAEEHHKPAVEIAGQAVSPGEKGNERERADKRGWLEFRDVTFRYPGAEKPVLHRISFRARPGETTAIIGSTGAGKSTLLKLALRFYDVESGAVLVNGVDVRAWPQQELRRLFGYVPQKAVIFSGTIADNVRFGNGELSEEEIRDALEAAQAMEFVQAREEGIYAPVSQAGANLSGGQKQRLSIARALARKPEFYLFDDSFSALDYKTDARLRQSLAQYAADSTILIVAQRVSTVIHAHQIIVLDDGEIAGIGTHKELAASNPVYKEIVASQMTEEESA